MHKNAQGDGIHVVCFETVCVKLIKDQKNPMFDGWSRVEVYIAASGDSSREGTRQLYSEGRERANADSLNFLSCTIKLFLHRSAYSSGKFSRTQVRLGSQTFPGLK